MEKLATDIPLTIGEDNYPDFQEIRPNSSLNTSSPWNLLDNLNTVENNTNIRTIKSAGKKIDMNAQCYIVTKKELDLDNESDSIDIMEPIIKKESFSDEERENNDTENDYVDVDTVSEQGTPILQAGDLNSLLEQFEATENNNCLQSQPPLVIKEEKIEIENMTEESNVKKIKPKEIAKPGAISNIETDKSRQILDSLPQELIMRIKASSKRKVIPVIDPIPNKRRGNKKPQNEVCRSIIFVNLLC